MKILVLNSVSSSIEYRLFRMDSMDALRVGLYMARGPVPTKGTVPDQGEERVSSGHRDYDCMELPAGESIHILLCH